MLININEDIENPNSKNEEENMNIISSIIPKITPILATTIKSIVSAHLICDSRENAVNPFISKYVTENIKYVQKQITIGDFLILHKHKNLVIERKTWADYADSIKDGRMKSQEAGFKTLASKYQVLYIIEGKMGYSDKSLIHRIPFKNLHAKLRHSVLRGIPHLQSRDPEHTAKILCNLAQDVINMNAGGKEDDDPVIVNKIYDDLKEIVNTNDTADNIVKELKIFIDKYTPEETPLIEGGSIESDIPTEFTTRKTYSNNELVLSLFETLPQVSSTTALILSARLDLLDILSKPQAELIEIISPLVYPTSGSKIGPIKAKKMVQITKELEIKMLINIPGITKETATMIINHSRIPKIKENRLVLSELKKKNRKLGKLIDKIIEVVETSLIS